MGLIINGEERVLYVERPSLRTPEGSDTVAVVLLSDHERSHKAMAEKELELKAALAKLQREFDQLKESWRQLADGKEYQSSAIDLTNLHNYDNGDNPEANWLWGAIIDRLTGEGFEVVHGTDYETKTA